MLRHALPGFHTALACVATLVIAVPAAAQETTPSAPAAPGRSPQSDLTLINLPTTLSIQRHRSYFRLTHRFARDLRRGDFGELAADLFSLDNGAVIGVEYRFALTSRIHAGVHRSMLSKTIQTFGKWDALRQEDGRPLSVSVLASFEGLDNLRQDHQPGIAATFSRGFGQWLLLYATPAFVWDTRAVDFIEGHDEHDDVPGAVDEHSEHENTAFIGLGTRVRVRPSVYVVAEVSPRVSGYDPGGAVWGAAIEKRTGGHSLQLNLSNSFGTTLGQLARGGSDHDIYLGFNITRRF